MNVHILNFNQSSFRPHTLRDIRGDCEINDLFSFQQVLTLSRNHNLSAGCTPGAVDSI
jgi:hypothetical protein